jgi:AraC-like DNA-binding protein
MEKLYNYNHYLRIIKAIIFVFLVTAWSCDKMDKTYAEFLESGQIIYNGKLDSVRTFPGKNRILVTWKPINDPRVTNVKVFWANNRESIEKPITSKNDTTLIIENLTEGNYTFNFITYDDAGNNSVPVEVVGMAYGEIYERGLVPRQIRNILLNNNELTINLGSTESLDNYYNQEITYISSSDQAEKTVSVPKEVSSIVIDDYSGDKFSHKGVYLPSELSPDFFYTETITQYTPVDPLLVYPQDGETGISCAPEFQWYNSALLPDGKYELEYSTDQTAWTSIVVTGKEAHIPKTILNPNTLYHWRIKATKGAETRISEIRNFTTGGKTLHADGEVVRVQSHTTGLNPVRIAFTGDGFQQADYNYNGPFDRYIEEAIEAFFSVEPYKSYREYFEVWKIAAYSQDRNISESDRSTRFNTVFESNYNGSTITCSAENVFQYVKNIPEVDDAALSEMTTIVVLNKKRQGGASYVTNDLKSIALVPLYRNNRIGVYTDFTDEVIRQGGGFSFGLLADESGTAAGLLPSQEENELRAAWTAGRFLNVDLTNNTEEVRWAHFIGRSGYARPGIYEGAYGYRSNIYRSEETSSMINGINYFNAISREIIVKRILRIAGESYSLDKFLEKDIARTPYQ